jgi:very-short-patch-repair endonuclease
MKYGTVGTMRKSKSAARSRQDLEARATPAERTLMVALRVAGEPYEFQYTVRSAESPCGYYVVDFYLPRRKLFVELDGNPHATEQGHWDDRLRTEAIERAREDCLVTRFWNSEVIKDAAAVVRFLQTY